MGLFWSPVARNGNCWYNSTNMDRPPNFVSRRIETRSTDSWLGVRVGEPGPTGYIGNVDFFSVTIGGVTKTFDFGN